ncbi:hypothetical protein [Frigoribacterium sp. MCBA15_019]|uniref:hypothetical protein n=1 Tax=Frigoribacterium sp. MCBA15_019 TaxID=1898745 RepID=UPI0008DDF75A|nr:hypothetical protein [Frigoribacterium sp. MCBA15_019]OII21329.1 hypothetical protein BIV04_11470 [Frigoribacterium sp. MCBA15_019]
MTAIPWTVVDPETIERMIAVGLCRRHQHARRIRPSQGDGGLDVLVPAGQSQFHVENYQVKKFADGLDDSRKSQIKKSLKTAISTHQDTTSVYTISRWYLALPMDLTREQETWLANVATELSAPFPVEVFGLTQIEDLLLESPNIREYYLGDGMDRVREILNQMSSLTGLHNLATDPTKIEPGNASSSLADLHQQINAADPHFDYDYQVTTDLPVIKPRVGLVASVIAQTSPEAPHVTWHVSTKYDSALEDRPIPGSYTLYPERMTPEQREAWEQWQDYGTPVTLHGDVVDDLTIDLPGGLGGELPASDNVLRIGPAVGEFDDEPTGRSLWVIEDIEGKHLAERLFSLRRTGRGIAGGEHLHGTDAEDYIGVDLFVKMNTPKGNSMKVKLDVRGNRWVGEPVQRVLPALRFCGSWGNDNRLRPQDEFGLRVAEHAFTLSGEAPISPALVAAVEDLARISTATKRPIALPESIHALADQKGVGLRIIADTVAGLEPEVDIGELVLWYEDDPAALDDLMARAETGKLTVPWAMPFPLLGDDFEFAFNLEITGEIVLVPDVESGPDAQSRKAVRLVPAATTRGCLRQNLPS